MSVAFVADDEAVPGDGARPRFAYGVGRRVGPAVVRNRVRRRLRAAAREIVRDEGGLPAGAYLVTVRPEAASLDYADLRRDLAAACRAASSPPDPAGSARTGGPA